jgi:hypothetical protein
VRRASRLICAGDVDAVTLIARLLGPALLLRAVSIVVDRRHFTETLGRVDEEARTLTFSFFPVALLIAFIALAQIPAEKPSLALVLLRIIAWGGIVKASALMLFPRAVLAKARLLEQAGFLNVVLLTCSLVGGYFTWFGYFARHR